MFLSETLIWLIEHGWLMLLHLSAKSSFPKPLPPEEERALIAEMAAGSEEAKRRLIEHNLRLVAHIAKKYVHSGVEQDDLVSIGSIGLMKAVQTFRPEAGRLTAYASRCIENEILMTLRANRKNRAVVLMGEAAGVDKEGRELPLGDPADGDDLGRAGERGGAPALRPDGRRAASSARGGPAAGHFPQLRLAHRKAGAGEAAKGAGTLIGGRTAAAMMSMAGSAGNQKL